MGIDLHRIAEENLRKYGTDIHRYGPVLLAHLYSDRTHFIFELLQNAEDAGASEVDFSLHPDRLEVRHDGRPFNEDDVRGISGLVEGTKSDDYTQIGQFGIGFKSVYAYTNSPEVHSSGHHFCIKNYVIPERIDSPVGAEEDLTTFVFPFNHREVFQSESYDQIKDRLSRLNLRTLLFLKNIQVVRWSNEGEGQGEYRRKSRERKLAHSVTLESRTQEERVRERWLIFRTPVAPPRASSTSTATAHIEVAYSIGQDESGDDQVTSVTQSPLTVFFETEKETDLGFLIQGPYVTTPARDNVPEKHEWNVELVSRTASLVVQSLRGLKALGLLSVQALNCMPLDGLDFPEGSMFQPIYEAVRCAIADEDFLPARGGGHTSGRNAVLARGADMVKLFNPRRLKELFALDALPKWLSTDISQARTPDLFSYLTREPVDVSMDEHCIFQVPEIRPETIAQRLSKEFMKNQSEAWVKQLYLYFASKHDLHSLLKGIPILKTARGAFVAAVDENNLPAVFLPSKNSSGYPTIKKSLAHDPVLKEFFNSLGLTEPDLTSEVLRQVLPKYSNGASGVGRQEHREDIERIASSLRSDSDLQYELEDALKDTAFLRGQNAKTGKRSFKKPTDLYRKLHDLEVYFEGNDAIWFLSEPDEYDDLFVELGVRKSVEVKCRRPGGDGHVVVLSENRNHQRGLDGFDPDCEIDGLAQALQSPTEEKAKYIWNALLAPHASSIHGKVQRALWHTYKHASEEDMYSPMGELATETRWLRGAGGSLVRPADLCADELPEDFVQCEELVRSLGMRPASISALAEESGIPVRLLDELRKAPDLFEEFLSWRESTQHEVDGFEEDEEALDEEHNSQPRSSKSSTLAIRSKDKSDYAKGHLDAKNQIAGDDNGDRSPRDYSTLLVESFNRSGEAGQSNDLEETSYYADSSSSKNPERRAQKLAERHQENLGQEPSSEDRRKTIERTLLEPSNPEVRSTLFQWYKGRCQICQCTWPERNGEPYFVSAYLVERKHARAYDDPANAICLCAEHFAQWKLAAREATDVVEQILDADLQAEEGKENLSVRFTMFDKTHKIAYCEQHFLALRTLLEASGV